MMRFLFSLVLLGTINFTNAQVVWETRTSMPDAADGRHHPVTFAIDGYGYVLTGGTENGDVDDMYKYDAATDSWTKMNNFPGGARGYAYGVATDTKGYVGFGTGRAASGQLIYNNDLWEFDPATEEWTQLADCPCDGRRHPAFVATEDKLFLGLGNGALGNLRDWWEYDIASNTWAEKPDFAGSQRHHPFHFAIDGLVYVAFGHGSIIFNDLYVYDPASEVWTFLGFLPDQGRVAGTEFAHGGKGYVLSGDDNEHENLRTGEMWSYDPSTALWTKETPHPGGGRWAPGCFVIDDNVYFTGGEDSQDNLYKDLMVYKLSSDNVATEDPLSSDLQIYPNPTIAVVHFDSVIPLLSAEIYNSQGQFLDSKQISNNKLDLSDLTPGLLMMVIKTTNTTDKLIKKVLLTR